VRGDKRRGSGRLCRIPPQVREDPPRRGPGLAGAPVGIVTFASPDKDRSRSSNTPDPLAIPDRAEPANRYRIVVAAAPRPGTGRVACAGRGPAHDIRT
jgi:hypothetical protein